MLDIVELQFLTGCCSGGDKKVKNARNMTSLYNIDCVDENMNSRLLETWYLGEFNSIFYQKS